MYGVVARAYESVEHVKAFTLINMSCQSRNVPFSLPRPHSQAEPLIAGTAFSMKVYFGPSRYKLSFMIISHTLLTLATKNMRMKEK